MFLWQALHVYLCLFLRYDGGCNSMASYMCKLLSNLWYKVHLIRQKNCSSFTCNWSMACRCCSNYIFILILTPGFNGLGKDKCKIRWDSLKYWDLVQFMLDILRYCHKVHGSMKKWDSHWQCPNLELFAYLYGEWQHSMDCMAAEEPLLGITCYVIHRDHRIMDTFLQLPSNL